MIRSHSLKFSDFDTGWYKQWAEELKQDKNNLDGHKLHANKFWQNVVMVQALYERGLLKTDKSCIGFGVGQERLSALFAKYGVKVTATDQDYKTEKAKHWQEHELATGAQSLNKLSICDPKSFRQNVSYRALDMNRVPKSLHGKYDFLWSNCALGHLGSIEAGLKFIEESAKCLKPGGIAVHTTEVNVLSDDETLDNNDETVIFRPSDIHRLSARLREAGYELSPLWLDFGGTPQDQRISMSPKFGNDYSKIQVGGYLATQVVLVIKHSPAMSGTRKALLRLKELYAYKHNLQQQKKFAEENAFLRSIRRYEDAPLAEDSIKAAKKTHRVTLKDRAQAVYIEYLNATDHPLFGMHDRLRTTKPIALATSGPPDRPSRFKSSDWFNDQANRPSIHLCRKGSHKDWKRADYIRPGEDFAYRLSLDPTKVDKGNYQERFAIVQEGNTHLADSEVNINVEVA